MFYRGMISCYILVALSLAGQGVRAADQESARPGLHGLDQRSRTLRNDCMNAFTSFLNTGHMNHTSFLNCQDAFLEEVLHGLPSLPALKHQSMIAMDGATQRLATQWHAFRTMFEEVSVRAILRESGLADVLYELLRLVTRAMGDSIEATLRRLESMMVSSSRHFDALLRAIYVFTARTRDQYMIHMAASRWGIPRGLTRWVLTLYPVTVVRQYMLTALTPSWIQELKSNGRQHIHQLRHGFDAMTRGHPELVSLLQLLPPGMVADVWRKASRMVRDLSLALLSLLHDQHLLLAQPTTHDNSMHSFLANSHANIGMAAERYQNATRACNDPSYPPRTQHRLVKRDG